MIIDSQDVRERMSRHQFLVIGGLNVDQLLRVQTQPGDDGTAVVTEYVTGFGGHAGNCACALARLGAHVAIAGAVGDDADGLALVSDLNACGIDTARVVRVVGSPTGRVVIPSFPDRRYMLMHRGANDVWGANVDAVRVAIAGFDTIVLFDPTLPFVDALFEATSGTDVRVYWNPGGILTTMPPILSRLGLADVLIVNRAEARAVLENASERDEMTLVSAVSSLHCFRLIETLGSDGARLHAAGKTSCARGWPADVVDETGAGDAFTAGFALFDTLGFDDRVALRIANVLGAAATEAIGAREGLPDLPGLMRRVDSISDARFILKSGDDPTWVPARAL